MTAKRLYLILVALLAVAIVALPVAAQQSSTPGQSPRTDSPSQTQSPSQSDTQSPSQSQTPSDARTPQSPSDTTQPGISQASDSYPQTAETSQARSVSWGWLIAGLIVGGIIGYAIAPRRPTMATTTDIRRDRAA